ncbi:Efflux transporter, RND family, MFP subunit [Candidatus Sulfotelmatomonas gaucii]|uniref:Efflux transporter, RND family, MFP subunit n=1 Tax=Candidatus Sulfuritelmatomonas gaucii TaxID=2043161 RepID=A0A2N9LW05_9BACT|nr:Efflux transporter, RND family, MFP subunit [Candidatus Sulfotelmatomonas gaucii]
MTVRHERRTATLPRYYALLAVSTGAMVLGGAMLSGCESHVNAASTGARPPMKVTVVSAAQSDVPITGEWVGTLDGYVNAQIQPQANGYLIRQDYREGSQVQEGQVLFEIDPRPFEAALQQAQGQLGQAQAQLALAQINVNRDTPLAQAHAIAQSQLDNEIQQKAQAEAAVRTAEAAVATANLNLGFTKVRSLITGVAGQATTQVGNLVSTQSVLTSVSQLNPIKVYFSISDSEYLALTKQADTGGSDLLHGASKIPLTLTLSDGEVYPQKGHVVFVDRQLDSQTGAIRIAAAFPNPGNILRPGQFGRVKAATEVLHNAILVPQAAVNEFQGQEQVFTIAANNTVHANNVTLGPQFGNNWVVESGLSGGSLVITDNVQKLREGEPVTPEISGQSASVSKPMQADGR